MTAATRVDDSQPTAPALGAAPAPRWRWPVLAVVVGALVAVAYGHCRHDFFLADDFNALYAASRASGLVEALDLTGAFRLRLIREVMPDFEATSTLLRPVTALSFWADWCRSGLEPTGYHVTAFLLHGLVTLSVAAFAQVLTRSFPAAVAAACVFVLHPAHVEAVLWIAARADLVVTLGMVTALIAWWRYLEHGAPAWLVAACALFATALLGKEMAATLPGLAAALVLAHPGPRPWRRVRTGLVAMALTLAAYAGLRLVLVGSFRGYYQPPGGVLGAAANAARFLGDALLLCVWPGDRTAAAGLDALRLIHAGGVAVLVAAAVRTARRRRATPPRPGDGTWRHAGGASLALALAAAFVLSTLPVATWAKLAPDGSGSRLVYPSLVLFAVAVAAAAGALWRRDRTLATATLAAVGLAGLFGSWRAAVPWQTAAAKARAMVSGLAAAASGCQALVLSNDLPAKVGPAYLAQNAFPCAAWLFVSRTLRIEWLPPEQWRAATVEHRETLARDPTVRALRWDDGAGRWLDAEGR